MHLQNDLHGLFGEISLIALVELGALSLCGHLNGVSTRSPDVQLLSGFCFKRGNSRKSHIE